MAIEAQADCVLHRGLRGGAMERRFPGFNAQLPLGEIHQIHGKGVGQRGFYDAQPGDSGFPPDCRADLGGNGAWTSWPPTSMRQT